MLLVDTFKSKIDLWLAVVFLGSIAVMIYVAIITPGLVIVLALGASSLLMLWVLLSTKYSVDDRELRVTSGPFRWVILVSDIQSVRPSNNLLSSPALSLDRLRIEYSGKKALLVSPKDKVGFIESLRSHGATLADL